jgi:hypothetical protein
MDNFTSYYVNRFYGIPLATGNSRLYALPLDGMTPDHVEILLRLNHPNETTARIYGWLDSQGSGSPESILAVPDYFPCANLTSTSEIDGDPFIRSEIL